MANETISLIKQANKSNKTKQQKQNKKQKTKTKQKQKNNNKSQIHGGAILRRPTEEPPKDSRGCVANTTSRPDDAGPGMQVKLSKSPRM